MYTPIVISITCIIICIIITKKTLFCVGLVCSGAQGTGLNKPSPFTIINFYTPLHFERFQTTMRDGRERKREAST